MSNRLKKNDISIASLLSWSYLEYKRQNIDDKKWRSKLDIISGKIISRKGLKYNRSTKKWEQSSREVKIELIVRTDPKSYEMSYNPLKIHKYPVTFLLKDFEKGFDSTFRWRTGSLYKPRFAPSGSSKQKKEAIIKYNLSKGIQLQFFFDLSYVLKSYNLLYGINWANRPPIKRNPKNIPFFDKHALYIVEKIFPRLFSEKYKGKLMKQLFKN